MNEKTEPIRVMLADDQELIRAGLRTLVESDPTLALVGEASDGDEVVELAHRAHPDVILMDIRMPVVDGVSATQQIHRQLPDCKILMLTTFNDDAYVLEALQAGASGYLLKDLPARDLTQAILAVHRGIYQLDPGVAHQLSALLSRSPAQRQDRHVDGGSPMPAQSASLPTPAKLSDLTEREREVLRLIARGATNREIAEELVISEGTVKNHISNILGRLNVRDRTQAAIYARDQGLL